MAESSSLRLQSAPDLKTSSFYDDTSVKSNGIESVHSMTNSFDRLKLGSAPSLHKSSVENGNGSNIVVSSPSMTNSFDRLKLGSAPSLHKSSVENGNGSNIVVSSPRQDSVPDNPQASITQEELYTSLVATDNSFPTYIDTYYSLIVEFVNSAELLRDLYDIVDNDERIKIRQLTPCKGTTELLEYLKDKKDCPGKWQRFVQALQLAGYQHLATALSRGDKLSDLRGSMFTNQMKLVELFARPLTNKIAPLEICPDLKSRDVLNDVDVQEIEAEKRNFGDIAGAVILIDRVWRRNTNWFPIFMDVLMRNGYQSVVKEVDEDVYNKLMGKLQERESLETSHSETYEKEPYTAESKSRFESWGKNRNDTSVKENYISGYTMISGILKGTEILEADYECKKRLIEVVFCEILTKKITPFDMYPELIGRGVITQIDYQNIQCEESMHEKSKMKSGTDPDKDKDETLEKHIVDEETREKREMVESGDGTMENYDSAKGPSQRSLKDCDVLPDQLTNTTENVSLAKLTPSLNNLNISDSDDKKAILYSRERSLDSEWKNLQISETNGSKGENTAASFKNMSEETSVKQLDTPLDISVPSNSASEETCLKEPNTSLDKTFSDKSRNLRSASSEMESGDSEMERSVLELRNYQRELAESSIKGINSIVVAPTGCGKTFVAMKIIEKHFETFRRRHPKVIFLTEQSALSQQQGDQMAKYLPHLKVKVITGETQKDDNLTSLDVWLDKRDILVVTAQLLVNALLDKDVQIKDFSLIIFDECHHTNGNHAYNKVMFHYMNSKLEEDTLGISLPQIVGLTASLGVGKAKTLDNAVQWVKLVMANLDAERIDTVTKSEEELKKYSQIPKEEIHEVLPRTDDKFREEMESLIKSIEDYIQLSNFAPLVPDYENILTSPSQKGSIQYEQWISGVKKAFARLRQQDAKRFFDPCRFYLEILNKTLIIHDDSRVKDALDYLREQFREYHDGHILSEIEQTLKQDMEKIMPKLQRCTDVINPKLDALEERIRNAFDRNSDSRGIVFVKTRELARAIVSWMKETPHLCSLNPIRFVGTHLAGNEGLTKAEQDEILRLFRVGNHKIIVATSVADEGLDIQACNLVIKYHQVTNEIVMVQRRGRARKKESEVVLFAEKGSKIAQKEELNMMRELMMTKAIKVLKEHIVQNTQEFMEEIHRLQQTCKTKRDNEERMTDGRIQREGEFELRCSGCRNFICMSYDIRKIQRAHHAVIGNDIRQQIDVVKKQRPMYEDPKFTASIGIIKCKDQTCKKDLGNISIFSGAQFPILKISNFSVVDNMGKYNEYKKWKQVPFHVNDMSDEDLNIQLNVVAFVDQ